MLLVNRLYAVTLVLAGVAWFWSGDTVGIVFGVAVTTCAYFVFKQVRWGYFAAALLCAGMLKLSIDRYSGVYSEAVKHTVSLLAFVGVIVAIILHEKFAKKSDDSSDSTDLS